MSSPAEPLVPMFDPASTRSLRSRLAWVPNGLRWSALVAMGLAAIGLHVDRRSSPTVLRGLNVVLVLDTSQSMLAQDFEPNRLGAAQRMAEAFVRRRADDRFGLITFAGDVLLECPVTADHETLIRTIHDVSTLNRADGTALGEAIAGGIAHLKAAPSNGRVIVILTDGASNAGALKAETVATMAAAYHIRVYAVGIGASGPVPYPTEFGTITVPLDLDETALRAVTAGTGGQYFRATDASAFDTAFATLDRLEPSQFVAPTRNRPVSLTPLLAIFALAALLIEEVIAATFLKAVTR